MLHDTRIARRTDLILTASSSFYYPVVAALVVDLAVYIKLVHGYRSVNVKLLI
jgi:hypothetical protein